MKKFIFIVLIITILAVLAGWVFKVVFIGQSGNNEFEIFVIEEGQGVKKISQNLKSNDLIDNSFVFEMYLWAKKYEDNLIAGEHQVNGSLSIRKLVSILISGNSISREREITTLEGWNLRDLGVYLVKEGVIDDSEELWAITGAPAVKSDPNLTKPIDFSAKYEFLKEKPSDVSLEGYLFPDTYRIFKDASIEDITNKMLVNFDKKITSKMLGDIFNQNKKLYEIITLASIIEKEGNTAENKKIVAGVYNNRLEVGMALQADPTVNYVTKKVTDRPTYEDLEHDSLYNTYLYPGLPPGPICNPGLDAIMAAIYPDNHEFFYFINTPDGEMVFAKTFEQHKQNRDKYFKD